ncbi:TetR/AcrR family transcriptional regulator [Klebsiella sp. T2.Ur]|nr:TetR/AcrR family transcriptional regulator [Klebsiella sp. T2.Ur]
MSTERSQKANDIIFFTRQLLTTGGYRSFSFADLSEKVNIRKASIHHHFSSKAELVRVVVSEYRQEARAGMQALSHQLNNPVAELQAYADYWAKCIQDGSAPFCICAMLAAETADVAARSRFGSDGTFRRSLWLADGVASERRKGKMLYCPVNPRQRGGAVNGNGTWCHVSRTRV